MQGLLVGFGGVIGALLRYYIGLWSSEWTHTIFPIGTFTANMIGSFILGWLTTRIIQHQVVHPYLAAAFGTGIIGSFTTFSTFSVETVQLIQTGHWQMALLYVLLSLLAGLLFSWSGFKMGKTFSESKNGGSKQVL
ncbi:fluoride efflux transporter CrcB [Fictibacillus barbaricus]|uniref:Fluoride-specific ion channel FluC n=1 Tax=Fictibacillus barbaricus TaxID=182136 RepID=A0ABU1U0U8_9BACL|nr:fluoride efflux transporter CrcB [Fictibacillus barbaricus]MDR7073090.1 CrcB protein [Fictibacillus barbaricus]